jgi:DNA-binding response OmpR family regulator
VKCTSGPSLKRREQQVLDYLRAHAGRVISRDELSDHVWGFRLDSRSRAVDQAIANVRKKLPTGAQIITRHGYGYEFVEDRQGAPIAHV